MTGRLPSQPCRHRQQRGVALVLVLWILLLVTVTTSAYTLTARMDQLEAHTVLSGTQARLAAEAGLNFAVLSLRDPNEQTRVVPDGRPYVMAYNGAQVEVRITDERGKLDINSAGEDVLKNLFAANGLDDQQATYLAAAVADWIDQDDIERASGAEIGTYEAAALGIGPANRTFIMVEELLQVLGMSWDLYTKMAPGLTVYSGSGLPEPAYAPAEALLALPDMNPEDALNFVSERHSEETLNEGNLILPNGEVVMARGRGLTYSILAKATLPNGVWDQVEATIRLGSNPNGTPYRILRWREGFHN